MDFNVQQYEIQIPAGASETTIQARQSFDETRMRVMHSSLAREANLLAYDPGVEILESRDFNSRIEIQGNGTEIKVYTNSNGGFDRLLRFSTLEYVGDHGGVNEFTVRRGVRQLSIALELASFTEMGVTSSTAQKLTLHSTGVWFDEAFGDDTGDQESAQTVSTYLQYAPNISTPFDDLTTGILGYDITEAAFVHVGWEAVNWIGSNWQVEHVPHGMTGLPGSNAHMVAYNSAGSDRTVTIPDIGDWESAWIESSRLSASSPFVNGELTAYVRKGSSTTTVELFQPTGSLIDVLATNGAVFYVIANPDIYVLHQGFDLGNGTESMDADGPTKLIPLATPNEISDGSPHVVSIAGGLELGGILGFHDLSAMFVSKAEGLRAWRTTPSGDWLEYIQTVQFEADLSDQVASPKSVIEKPGLSVSFVVQ